MTVIMRKMSIIDELNRKCMVQPMK